MFRACHEKPDLRSSLISITPSLFMGRLLRVPQRESSKGRPSLESWAIAFKAISSLATISNTVFFEVDLPHHWLQLSKPSGNRKPPGSFRKPFTKHDPRLQLSIQPFDPRIHFALNCGAKSCPALRIFSAQHVRLIVQQTFSHTT